MYTVNIYGLAHVFTSNTFTLESLKSCAEFLVTLHNSTYTPFRCDTHTLHSITNDTLNALGM